MLPVAIRKRVSEFTRNEIAEATKCLTFDLPTAAGFHLIRALKSAIREYYDAVSDGAARPVLNNDKSAPMGAYIASLERIDHVGKELIGILRQIKVLHREPQMHPEAVLDMDEAVILMGIVTSAIWAMFKGLPKYNDKENTEDAEGSRDTDSQA